MAVVPVVEPKIWLSCIHSSWTSTLGQVSRALFFHRGGRSYHTAQSQWWMWSKTSRELGVFLFWFLSHVPACMGSCCHTQHTVRNLHCVMHTLTPHMNHILAMNRLKLFHVNLCSDELLLKYFACLTFWPQAQTTAQCASGRWVQHAAWRRWRWAGQWRAWRGVPTLLCVWSPSLSKFISTSC